MSGELTQVVKTRVNPATKQALLAEMHRSARSESAIVRLALIEYLARRLNSKGN